MPQTFTCPTCGAPLDYKGGADLTIRCEFCGTSVIVPEELRTTAPASPPSPAADPVAQTLGHLKEFAEIARLVRDGNKIEAIKLYRQITGVGLKEAKDVIDKMAAGRVVEVSNYTIHMSQTDVPPSTPGRAEQIQRIGEVLKAGNKIEAIKLYREMTGVGLKEAKDAIEKLETTIGTPGAFDIHPPEVTATTPRYTATRTVSNVEPAGSSARGCIIVAAVLIIVAVVAIGAFLAFSASEGNDQLRSIIQSVAGVTDTPRPTATLIPSPTPAPTDTPQPTATPGFANASILVGDRGTLPGQFNNAHSIGLDGEGNIYVAEYTGGRVQVFDPIGQFITQWRIGDESGYVPRIAVDYDGNVYAVYNGNIYEYEGATGKLLKQIEYSGGQGFQDVAVAADGGLVASWNRDWQGGLFVNFSESQDDIVVFDPDGKVVAVIGKALSEVASGNAELETAVAVDVFGNIYASGLNNSGIFKFSPEGKFLDKFAEDQVSNARAMAADFQGRLFVSNSGSILIFDSEGRYLDLIDASPDGMVFNQKDELFTIDDPQVIKYTLNR